jgi:hypothetical protein
LKKSLPPQSPDQKRIFSPITDKRNPAILTIAGGEHVELEIIASKHAFTSFDKVMIGRPIGQVEGGYVISE